MLGPAAGDEVAAVLAPAAVVVELAALSRSRTVPAVLGPAAVDELAALSGTRTAPAVLGPGPRARPRPSTIRPPRRSAVPRVPVRCLR